MTILDLKDFMENYNFKKDTMNGSDLTKVLNCPLYPRDSEIHLDN